MAASTMMSLAAYRRDQGGASAVEFALILPVALALVMSTLHLSFVVYSAVTLHFATEETARCLSVSANNPISAQSSTDCPPSSTAAQIQAFGATRYLGPNISPTFTVGASAACTNGKQLTATGTYNMAMGVITFPIPVTAKSCFPYLPGT